MIHRMRLSINMITRLDLVHHYFKISCYREQTWLDRAEMSDCLKAVVGLT